jgi:hypothetical protein
MSVLATGAEDNAHSTIAAAKFTIPNIVRFRKIIQKETDRNTSIKMPGGRINGVIAFLRLNRVRPLLSGSLQIYKSAGQSTLTRQIVY